MKTLKWREFEAKPKPKAKEERQIQRTGLWYGLDRWEETRLCWGMTSSVFGEKEIKKDLRNLDKFVSWGIRVLWQSNSRGVKFVTLTGSSLARHVALPDHGVGLDGSLGKDDRIAGCWTLGPLVAKPYALTQRDELADELVSLSSPTLGVGWDENLKVEGVRGQTQTRSERGETGSEGLDSGMDWTDGRKQDFVGATVRDDPAIIQQKKIMEALKRTLKEPWWTE
ncbi:hypothetical protein F2Q68_00038698 [Brassica cretica]|uniref:Uncharacterized protein n=1 Tax=Brassica cretica TaxID=69181 RepID=A0A8S9MT04_BRACR|nr:hypothetical protein F2Q68_00038698 [Brassica cretica]